MLFTRWLNDFSNRIRSRRAVTSIRNRRSYRTHIRSQAEILEQRTLLTSPDPLNLSSATSSQALAFTGGAAGDMVGTSVSSAGDFNGDGFDDILIAAPFADPLDRTDAGEVYLVFGTSAPTALPSDLSQLSVGQGLRILGPEANSFLGRSVAPAGDLNGDGFADLLIGMPRTDEDALSNSALNNTGFAWVVFGREALDFAALDLLTATANDGVAATSEAGSFGYSVAGAGDVNQDGFADVIVGAPGADYSGLTNPGLVVVYYGSEQFTFSESTILVRRESGGVLGAAVGGGRDVNGDGIENVR